ncbi:hypothetical protein V8G54_020747 [Vigna mungo]|uniref:Uncharacterized protein n=1 Tax=Vigna mungo TaxID=3915 RepID=A0AAQ3NE75_VIGMU
MKFYFKEEFRGGVNPLWVIGKFVDLCYRNVNSQLRLTTRHKISIDVLVILCEDSKEVVILRETFGGGVHSLWVKGEVWSFELVVYSDTLMIILSQVERGETCGESSRKPLSMGIALNRRSNAGEALIAFQSAVKSSESPFTAERRDPTTNTINPPRTTTVATKDDKEQQQQTHNPTEAAREREEDTKSERCKELKDEAKIRFDGSRREKLLKVVSIGILIFVKLNQIGTFRRQIEKILLRKVVLLSIAMEISVRERKFSPVGSSTVSGFFAFQVVKRVEIESRLALLCLGGFYDDIDEVVGSENVGRTCDWIPAICSSVYVGCHGSVIWLPEKMKDGIPGAMFCSGSAFGPFHVFYEMR